MIFGSCPMEGHISRELLNVMLSSVPEGEAVLQEYRDLQNMSAILAKGVGPGDGVFGTGLCAHDGTTLCSGAGCKDRTCAKFELFSQDVPRIEQAILGELVGTEA